MELKLALLRNRPKIEIFNLLNQLKDDDLRVIVDELVDNKIFISNQYPLVDINGQDLWFSNPLNNRTWCYWVHALVIIEYLVNGYDKFHDRRYMDKALELFLNWKQFNFPDSKAEMAWHDHGTALRLIVICRLFESWKMDFWDDKLAWEFCHTVEKHCQMLANPEFYTAKHNHGIDQDRALYVAAIVFDQLASAPIWRELAINRLKLQLDQLFLPDGSYLENTPLYSYIFCTRLSNFMQFIERHNESEYQLLEKTVSKQLEFLSCIVQPDGFIPPIGDGNPSRLSIKNLQNMPLNSLNHMQYLISGGKRGIPPLYLDKVFSDGNYAVMRNQWNYNEDTVQLLFYSTFHTKTHKHHDDLSIILFGHGQALLTDAGKYDFNYDRPERQFAISSRAHNSVVADDMDTNISPINVGKSGLTSYYFADNFSYVSGAHGLYTGLTHQRILLYLKPWDILVLDWIAGQKEHKFEQFFNFHPTVECSLRGNVIIAQLQNGSNISIQPLFQSQNLDVQLVRGQKNPLRGWCSLEYSKLLEAWSAGYILRNASSAAFASHINLKPAQHNISHFTWQDDLIRLVWQDNIIQIAIGEETNTLTVDGKELELNQIRNLSSITKRQSAK